MFSTSIPTMYTPGDPSPTKLMRIPADPRAFIVRSDMTTHRDTATAANVASAPIAWATAPKAVHHVTASCGITNRV